MTAERGPKDLTSEQIELNREAIDLIIDGRAKLTNTPEFVSAVLTSPFWNHSHANSVLEEVLFAKKGYIFSVEYDPYDYGSVRKLGLLIANEKEAEGMIIHEGSRDGIPQIGHIVFHRPIFTFSFNTLEELLEGDVDTQIKKNHEAIVPIRAAFKKLE